MKNITFVDHVPDLYNEISRRSGLLKCNPSLLEQAGLSKEKGFTTSFVEYSPLQVGFRTEENLDRIQSLGLTRGRQSPREVLDAIIKDSPSCLVVEPKGFALGYILHGDGVIDHYLEFLDLLAEEHKNRGVVTWTRANPTAYMPAAGIIGSEITDELKESVYKLKQRKDELFRLGIIDSTNSALGTEGLTQLYQRSYGVESEHEGERTELEYADEIFQFLRVEEIIIECVERGLIPVFKYDGIDSIENKQKNVKNLVEKILEETEKHQ